MKVCAVIVQTELSLQINAHAALPRNGIHCLAKYTKQRNVPVICVLKIFSILWRVCYPEGISAA
jgi:hypothetical protein